MYFTPQHNVPPTTSPAALTKISEHLVVAFSGDGNATMVVHGYLAETYAGGSLSVQLIWTTNIITVLNVRWKATFERAEIDALKLSDTTAFGTATTITAASAGGVYLLARDSITCTAGATTDSLAAGEAYRLSITRTPGDALDTLGDGGTAYIKGVRVIEV
jgi:hypothetical protein